LKKKIIVLCSIFMVFILFVCLRAFIKNDKEKYMISASISYGAVDDENLDKTRIAYEITVSGSKEDINNIFSQELLINPDYKDLILEKGPYNFQVKGTKNPYIEVTGSLVFDTRGKSKEDIDDMNLLQGIKVIDMDNNEYTLAFKSK
jgi:hypothetical protein